MKKDSLPKRTLNKVDLLVNKYEENIHLFHILTDQLNNLLSKHDLLKPHIHSVKHRVKDPEHLGYKLIRKAIEARKNKVEFDIAPENLFQKIEDLSGVRILHLHTEQIKEIDEALRKILEEQKYPLVEGPIANTWDVEYENFYKSLSMEINQRDSLYTSVHYVIQAGNEIRAEIQIRTLFEEVWGEVSHRINYPSTTNSISCQEQIKVLARVTSSGTRLVDSIFKSEKEYKSFGSS